LTAIVSPAEDPTRPGYVGALVEGSLEFVGQVSDWRGGGAGRWEGGRVGSRRGGHGASSAGLAVGEKADRGHRAGDATSRPG